MMAIPTIIGIVSMDKSVVIDTHAAESGTSASYFCANMVVFAAHGAEVAITPAIKTVPLIPHTYIPAKKIKGETIRRNTMEIQVFFPVILKLAPTR